LSAHALAGHRPISVLDGKVLAHDEAIGLSLIETSVAVFRVPMVDMPVGAALRLVIDASDVALATTEPSGLSIRNRFKAKIGHIEALDRSQLLIGLTVAGGGVTSILTRDAASELRLAPGGDVWCLVKSVAVDRVPR
jgi:molybdate transport system ATP-binding protein